MRVTRVTVCRLCSRIIDASFLIAPFTVSFSSAVTNVFFAIALAGFLVKKVITADMAAARKNPILIPFSLIILVSLVSFVNTVSLRASLQGMGKWLRYLAIFLAVTEEVKDASHAKKIVTVILLGLLAASLDGLFQFYTGKDLIRNRSSYEPEIGLSRLTAAFPHTNYFGSYLGLFLPLSICLAWYSSQKGPLKSLAYLTSVLGLFCLLFTFSRSSFLGFLTAILLIGTVKKDRMAFVAIVFLVAMITLFMPQQIRDWAETTRSPIEFIWHAQKIGDWRNAVNMIRHNPLIGVGVNTYSLNIDTYKIRDSSRFVGEMGYAHNIYLHMMAEIGPLGLAVFLWLLFCLFKTALNGYRSALEPSLKILILGIASGILGFLVDGFGETVLYQSKTAILFWFYVGLLLAVCRHARAAGKLQEETILRPMLK